MLEKSGEINRQQLVQELHDMIRQTLTALNLNLSIMRTQVPTNQKLLLNFLEDSQALVEKIAANIKDLINELTRDPALKMMEGKLPEGDDSS